MNGTVRIGGALIAGIIIIFGALRVSSERDYSQEASVVVSHAPERLYIDSPDTDSDGIKDWEEGLSASFPEVSLGDGAVLGASTSKKYAPPTTLTGKFSEAFMYDYLQGKMGGEDFSDPTAFADKAVKAIEKNTQSKTHSRLELRIIESTPETIHAYGNEVMDILNRTDTHGGDEAEILYAALQAQDPSMLAPLETLVAMYTNIISQTLATPVPSVLVDEHIAYLNSIESNILNIQSMQAAFADPLFALARLNKFVAGKEDMANAFIAMAKTIDSQDVVFTDGEPGQMFYLFVQQ